MSTPDARPVALPVIFRKERDGDVTAVFPTLAADRAGHLFTVYAHIGQHSAGSFGWYRETKAARPPEYASLLAELRSIYETGPDAVTLQIYARMTPAHRRALRS